MTWQEQAACAQAVALGIADPDDWFPARGKNVSRKARAICASCPVTAECLTFVTHLSPREQMHGVWGGVTPNTRIEWRRRPIRNGAQTKECHHCGGEYARPTTQSMNQWKARKYCSQECSVDAMVANRRARQREAWQRR